MKNFTVALGALVLLTMACGTQNVKDGDDGKSAAKSDSHAQKQSSLTPREELRAALKSMQKVTSYRADADMIVSGQKVKIEGRFDVGSVLIIVHRADGKVMIGVAVGDRVNVSEDDGATWKVDDGKNVATLSALITSPVANGDQIPDQGEVTLVGEEEIDGVQTRHFRVGASNPIDVWIAAGPGMQVVRKLKTVIAASDVDADASITFSHWNEPTGIEMPAGAP